MRRAENQPAKNEAWTQWGLATVALVCAASCTNRSVAVVEHGPAAAVLPVAVDEAHQRAVQDTECRLAYAQSLFVPPRSLRSEDARQRSDAIIAAVDTCPPASAAELATTGLAYHLSRDQSLASEYASRAVSTDSESSLARLVRGIVHRAADDMVAAEADLRRATELDPDNVAAQLEYALVLKGKGEVAGSRAALERAIKVDPEYVIAQRSLAISYFEAGEQDLAVPHCEAVLAHVWDGDMHVCRGLARARSGDAGGALEDLEEGFGADWADDHAAAVAKALRDGYLAMGDPMEAALYTCVDSGLEDAACKDEEVRRAVAKVRTTARQRATDGSFATTRGMTTRAFAKELAAQAKVAAGLDAFVHPDIGVFTFDPSGAWSLSRGASWPEIAEAQPPLTLADLRRARRLPKTVETEDDELDCGYPLDGLIADGEPGGIPLYNAAGASGVYDAYRYAAHDPEQDSLSESDFHKMQRAALAITHHVVFSRETYEFGKIGDRWYLLTLTISYDPDDDRCG